MATSVTSLIDRLKRKTRQQETGIPLTDQEYADIMKEAISNLYVDTGRASQYDEDTKYYTDEDTGCLMFEDTLPADEIAYLLLIAQIDFYNYVKANYSSRVGYTTDAISVTGADKPYANIKDTLSKLENERRIKYFKMFRYVIPDA